MARRGTMRQRGRGRNRDRDDDREERGRDRSRDRRDRDDDDREERGHRSRDHDRGRRGGQEGRFEYHDRGRDAAERRATHGSGDRKSIYKSNVQIWTAKQKNNCIRILPPTWEDADHFGFDVYVHYGVGSDNSAYLSLKKMLDKDDPIYEEFLEAQRAGDEDYAKDLKPRHSVLYWIIDRDDERKGPQLWLAPYQSIDQELAKMVVDDRTGEVFRIDHPEEGYDIEFYREGQGLRTKYSGLKISRHSSSVGDEEWLEYVQENPIPDMLYYPTYDEVADDFRGGIKRSESERDDDRNGGNRRRSRDDDRDDDRNRGRGRRGGSRDSDITWEDLLDMSRRDLERIVEDEDLNIDPDDYDADILAEEIAKELGIEPPREMRGGRRSSRDRDDDEDDDHMDRMERRRGRGRGRGR